MQVCSYLMDESTASVGGAGLRGQLTRHLSGCFHRIESDFQNQNARRATASTFSLNSSVESAEDRLVSCEDRLYASSSSSEKCPSPATIPVLSPMSVSPSPNFKSEVSSKKVACSSGFPVHFPTVLCSSQESSRDFTAAKHASHPTTSMASQTRFPSNHSTVPFQSNSSSQFIQHQSSCLSPKKGDEFPGYATRLSSPITVKVGQPKSTSNPFDHTFREPIPVVNLNSSAVWRPW